MLRFFFGESHISAGYKRLVKKTPNAIPMRIDLLIPMLFVFKMALFRAYVRTQMVAMIQMAQKNSKELLC